MACTSLSPHLHWRAPRGVVPPLTPENAPGASRMTEQAVLAGLGFRPLDGPCRDREGTAVELFTPWVSRD